MATKISALTAYATPLPADLIPIVDVANSITKKIKVSDFIFRNYSAVIAPVGSAFRADYYTDGTADDVQINSAIADVNAAGGGTILIKRGNYTIADIILIKSNITLLGEGIGKTVIKCVNAYNPATKFFDPLSTARIMMMADFDAFPFTADVGKTLSNVTVSGITFDANVANIPGLTSDSSHRAIWIHNAQTFKFIQNEVKNTINWSVFFQFGNNLWIEDNIVTGGVSNPYDQNDGIHLRNCQHFYIRGNRISTVGPGGDDGIAVLSDAFGTADTAYGIVANNIINAGSRGLYTGNDSNYHVRNIVWSNNVVESAAGAGIMMQKFGVTTGKFMDIIYTGNNIYNSQNGMRMECTVAQIYAFKGVVVNGNTFRFTLSNGDGGIHCIVKGKNLTITNNHISESWGTAGIKLGTTSCPIRDYVISGNSLDLGNNQANGTGIDIFGGSRGVINNNQINGNTNGATTGIKFRGNATAGNDASGDPNAEHCFRNVCSGNVIYGYVNGITEVAASEAPNYNIVIGNLINATTTQVTIIGANSSAPTGTNLTA